MQHFDCANFPPDVKLTRMPDVKRAKQATSTKQASSYLESNSFTEFSEEELSHVRWNAFLSLMD